MAISTFIPQVWSALLKENLRKNLVFGSLCNRNYEGDIAQWGDTVHIHNLADITVRPYTPNSDIAEPEQLSGEDTTLVIDHGVYYNFYINDVDKAQTNADLMSAAMRGAAHRIAEDTEEYIISKIVEGAGEKTSSKVESGKFYELLVSLKMSMDEKNVPRAGRVVIVPPSVEADLLLDQRFITGNGAVSDARLAEGSVARAAGFDIYISNDLSNQLIAMTPDAVTFANQITQIEAYRREKGFDDGVKGLSLCGAKVIIPDAVLVHTITA